MKRCIVLIIGLFTIHPIQSMESLNHANRHQHRIISKQAAQLIDNNINANTITKWQHVLEEANKFQQANPQFPYRNLARRPDQGPDAQSIANAAPVIIDFLQHKPVAPEQLRKLRYTVGDQYIVKMIDIDAKTLTEWGTILKGEAAKSNPRFPYPVHYSKKINAAVAPIIIDFLEQESVETDKLKTLRHILGDQHTLQVIDTAN